MISFILSNLLILSANSSSGAVPEESLPAVSPDVKPVVYLNLASPLDIGSDSPVNEQVIDC